MIFDWKYDWHKNIDVYSNIRIHCWRINDVQYNLTNNILTFFYSIQGVIGKNNTQSFFSIKKKINIIKKILISILIYWTIVNILVKFGRCPLKTESLFLARWQRVSKFISCIWSMLSHKANMTVIYHNIYPYSCQRDHMVFFIIYFYRYNVDK